MGSWYRAIRFRTDGSGAYSALALSALLCFVYVVLLCLWLTLLCCAVLCCVVLCVVLCVDAVLWLCVLWCVLMLCCGCRVYFLSFFTYSVRGACQNEMIPLTFFCEPEELLQISPLAVPVCPIPNGVAALAVYNMDPSVAADGTPDNSEK